MVARLRQSGIKVLSCRGVLLFSRHLEVEANHLAPLLEADLRKAGFCINLDKSITNPTRDIRHLDFMLYFVHGTFTVPCDRWDTLQSGISDLVNVHVLSLASC
jgi:hypothetical protein